MLKLLCLELTKHISGTQSVCRVFPLIYSFLTLDGNNGQGSIGLWNTGRARWSFILLQWILHGSWGQHTEEFFGWTHATQILGFIPPLPIPFLRFRIRVSNCSQSRVLPLLIQKLLGELIQWSFRFGNFSSLSNWSWFLYVGGRSGACWSSYPQTNF